MLLGHFAVPVLLKHYFALPARPLFAGTLFPDVVDKALHEAGLAINGRTWAHTLFTLATTTLLVAAVWGRRTAQSWFVAYLGHLVCDTGGHVPWFFPFTAYDFKPSDYTFWQKVQRWAGGVQFVELGLVLWATAVALQVAGRRFEHNYSRRG